MGRGKCELMEGKEETDESTEVNAGTNLGWKCHDEGIGGALSLIYKSRWPTNPRVQLERSSLLPFAPRSATASGWQVVTQLNCPPKMYTVFCLLEGESDPFSVKIIETQSVNSLKKEIKKEALVAVDDNHLDLYHVNLEYDASDEQKHITQANEILQGLSNHKPLPNPLLKLSTIEGFPKGFIHILVKLPPSGSIQSRACGAVAETHPPNPQFHAMSSHLDHCECLHVSTSVATNRSQAGAFTGTHRRFEGHQSQSHLLCKSSCIV